MSPTLFNIYLMDLEAEMRKEQLGGMVVMGKEKFWLITYADDIVLVAKSEQELKSMMRRLKKYIDKKGLILSPGKSKMVMFEKRRGKTRKREEMGRGKGRGERNKIFRLYNAEKWRSRETCGKETKKSCDRDETDVEHRRKIIQRRLHEKSEDVQRIGGQRGTVWDRNMGMEKGRKIGQGNEKIHEMDLRARQKDAKLHNRRRDKNEGNKNRSHEKSDKV